MTAMMEELMKEEKKTPKRQHKNFEDLLHVMKEKVHVFLVGPAGSGKTMGVEKAAEQIGQEFYCVSVGPQTTQTNLMGYMDATGTYRATAFRRAYENGGVFLLDEFDAGNPSVMTVLNAALATDVCSFPDGMIPRHEKFVCVAAGNTYGTGANRQYIGRNQLDAASLDRFYMMDWPYDEDFERMLADHDDWVDVVQAIRKALETEGVKAVVSPRASIHGAKLLRSGHDVWKTINGLIFKGINTDTVDKIKAEKHVKRALRKLLAPGDPAEDARERREDLLELLADEINGETGEFRSEADFGHISYSPADHKLVISLQKRGAGTLSFRDLSYISDARELKAPEGTENKAVVDALLTQLTRCLGKNFKDMNKARDNFMKALDTGLSSMSQEDVTDLEGKLNDLKMYLETFK